MKRLRIQAQLFLWFGGLLSLTAALLFAYQLWYAAQAQQRQQLELNQWLVMTFVRDCTDSVLSRNWALLNITLGEMSALPQVELAYVLDQEGTILDASDPSFFQENRLPRRKVVRLLQSGSVPLQGYRAQGFFSKTIELQERLKLKGQELQAGERLLEISVLLNNRGAPLGRLMVLFNDDFEQEILQREMRNLMIMLGVSLIFSLALVSYLSRRLSRPLVGLADKITDHSLRWRNLNGTHYLRPMTFDPKQITTFEVMQLVEAVQVYQQTMVHLMEERAQAESDLEESNTELKQSNEALMESQRQLRQATRLATMGEVLGMVAHQWRQPLAVISTLAQGMILKRQLKKLTDEGMAEGLDKIQAQTEYLSQTIEDFRKMLQAEQQPQPTDLVAVCNQALSLMEQRLQRFQVEVSVLFEEAPLIESLPSELLQVLLNLISNAVDAMQNIPDDKRTLTFTLQDQEALLLLTVCDSGGGIPEDLRERIFEPYFSTKRDRQGTGLGLHMSRMIVEQHLGGRLTVENQGPGACFCIQLPKQPVDPPETLHG